MRDIDFGVNLGHGLTGLWGDEPRADGTSATRLAMHFWLSARHRFRSKLHFLSPGPSTVEPGEASCVVRTQLTGYYGTTEYVDVGDHIQLTNEANGLVRLERDPLCITAHQEKVGSQAMAGRFNPCFKITLYCPTTGSVTVRGQSRFQERSCLQSPPWALYLTPHKAPFGSHQTSKI